MAQQDPVEEWKKKYNKALDRYEEQRSYDELLQRSLGRLALAAQGLDPRLDNQLKLLRTTLRAKTTDKKAIERILVNMENAIVQMEENRSKKQATAGPQDILIKLVEEIDFPKPQRSEAKSLLKKLKKDSSDDISAIVDECLVLIDAAISHEESSDSGKFRFNLFGRNKTEAKPTFDSSDIVEGELETPVHIVLMQLIENLSLPSEQCTKILKLRHQIEKGITEEELPEVIDTFTGIISSLSAQLVTDKLEYEKYLASVSSQLSSLDDHIQEKSEAEAKAFKAQHAMGQAVEDQVAGLKSHVAKASNLDDLKSSVNTRLATLSDHIEKHHVTEQTNFDQSQQQIQLLNQRIQKMEKESQELQKAVEEQRKLALKDPLTGMWNRQALNEQLEKEFARWQRYNNAFSIVMWDLDYFKRINDKYGHAAGDKVLKTFARTFEKATRETDFIARFGGEEFTGIFPETQLSEALTLANKIREKVENSHFHYQEEKVQITASAGVATISPKDTLDDLFQRADKALYDAKNGGRNRCVG
jgi:diguanylate cyclase